MKKALLFLYSTLCTLTFTLSPLWGQGGVDSVRITHTQEAGTLEKQRFIDRYDYVFMTKEPTKWMLKLYNNDFNFTEELFYRISYDNLVGKLFPPLELAAEYKLSPAFSVSVGAKNGSRAIAYYDSNIPYVGSGTFGKKSIVAFGELRWFYQLANRVKRNLSANNFSGNYIGVRFSRNIHQNENEFQSARVLYSNRENKWTTDYYFERFSKNIEVRYGVQRRFLKHGLIDFGINVGVTNYKSVNQKIFFKDGDNTIYPNGFGFDRIESVEVTPNSNRNEWYINSNFRLGLAIGDFKKRQKAPLCDVLQCFEDESSMFKISWPSIQIGQTNQSALLSLAYEHKIGKSAFSVNNQINYAYRANKTQSPAVNGVIRTRNYWSSNLALVSEVRYYVRQAARIRRLNKGNNLSGLYLSTPLSIYLINSKDRVTDNNVSTSGKYYSLFSDVGLKVGFQQKLFNKGYIDLGLSANTAIVSRPQKVRSGYEWNVRPTFGIGFAL
jgi:hypothetical protein